MSTHNTLFISTAIPFANSRPHLGFALELCIADALARHARTRGRDVLFVSGSDDHSLKNVLAAEQAGQPTAAFVQAHAQVFLQLGEALDISVDRYIHTSHSPSHRPAVYALWNACLARGDLYRGSYRGLYCVGCERFADPDELSCAEHAAPLEHVEEDNWYFRLSRYRELVQARIESGAFALTSPAREEILAFLREPLRDLCVSRSAERARGWGLPVPGDPSQVIWVWFDALAYYLSSVDHGSAAAELSHFWHGNGQRVHVIGKGIARFHAVIWPAILESAGIVWPNELRVHGYLTLEGGKISKSGRALDPQPLIEQLGSDALRYYLLRQVRTTRDGDYSHARFVAAYNADLANGLGNLANRLFGLVQRCTGGTLPPAAADTPDTAALREAALALPAQVDRAVERFALDEALAAVWKLIELENRTLDRTAPWALIKRGEHEAAAQLLRALLEALQVIARELAPFLPRASHLLSKSLCAPPASETQERWNVLPTGERLPASLSLFPRWTEDAPAASAV
jgi:methionyl-tRNA synthetase